jgi:hypothetical protein
MSDLVRLPKWAQREWVYKIVTKETFHVSKTVSDKEQKVSWGGRRIRFWANLVFFYPFTTAFLLFSFGLSVAAFVFGWSGFFSRMGAMIAAAGVVFALTTHGAMKKRLDQRLFAELLNGAQQISLAITRQAQAGRVTEVAHSSRLQSDVDKMVDEFDKERRPFELFESSLVLLGTLQWSFGDLLVNKLIACGEWQCSS